MFDKLKQKITTTFIPGQEYQACLLFDLIQKHIKNDGLEGEEIAKIIITHLCEEDFLVFEPHMFAADMFYLLWQPKQKSSI
jgi:hypothetical protein